MSQETPRELTGSDFAAAWDKHHVDLSEWLKTVRFSAQQNEVEAAFSAAAADVCRDDWVACRNEFKNDKGTVKTARKYLEAAFNRAVRAIEIKLWSRLILGKDHIPSGPLALPDTWRYRLTAPWNAKDARNDDQLTAVLGDLAKAGWAALGGYGRHASPSKVFLEKLQHRLNLCGSWENILNTAMYGEPRDRQQTLLEAFRDLAMHERVRKASEKFKQSILGKGDEAVYEVNEARAVDLLEGDDGAALDGNESRGIPEAKVFWEQDNPEGERAFHWAVSFLIENKFKSPDFKKVHEVGNPVGYLINQFGMALKEFDRRALRTGAYRYIEQPRDGEKSAEDSDPEDNEKVIQRVRPEKWMKALLHKDWADIYRLMIKYHQTEEVVHRFLLGERIKAKDEDDTNVLRMPAGANKYLKLAQQIEASHVDRTERARAIAVWCRSHLDLIKKWRPAPSQISINHTGEEDEENRDYVPATTLDPLTQALGEESPDTLQQAKRIASEHDNLEDKLSAVNRYLIAPDFVLTKDEIKHLRILADRPESRKGRPPDIPPLSRLNQALKHSAFDISIVDYMSVIFPGWREDAPKKHTDTEPSEAKRLLRKPESEDTP